MFLKSHDGKSSDAKAYIILIAIFGLILTLVLIVIALMCWRESVKDKELAENEQLSQKMVMYENELIAG